MKTFLERLAANVRKDGRAALDQENEKTKRRMDSLLRRFNSSIENGLFSPLFQPDPDAIEREAARLAPKTDTEIARISETQAIAERNLSHYLSADYLDVYVATSMRSDADFISVNRFAKALFGHSRVKALNLRYFNPTQSWIDDRIAKGLVEALMLRRADVTIYMAQKADSFGKDSEASVALGQGKPVVVYVPKLHVPSAKIDSEELARKSRSDRIEILRAVDSALLEDLDDSVDDEALLSRILQARLATLEDGELIEVLREHAADFDLLAEAERVPESNREEYRRWIEDVVEARTAAVPSTLRRHIDGILVAVAARFERRAHLFREIHPLALQVILSTGVLNGILVVRSVEQCAVVLEALITNSLRMRLEKDDQNYRLIEENTGSTVRVISRHTLLRNAFESFYFSQVRRDERKTG
ncbi:hypothetical protein WME90_35245 [Sorangium sp. So ce375]|uniref:hypothetical protein n=1 Tax=Sorangium sp. So ce375 TaxID=3133306 RepID=UPI003F5C2BCA